MPERDRGGSRLVTGLGILLGLLLVAGGVAWFLGQEPRSAPAAATTDDVDGSAPSGASSALPEPTPGRTRPGAPERVVIPALGVDAPVVPVRAPESTLTPPSDPQELGWWSDGAEPGARRGSVLVTGHTVHTGGGALDDLETLVRGDRVRVRTDHGWIAYRVSQVHTYSKGRIAEDAERLFSQRVPGRLVLITCEDWDGTAYLSNNVVTAEPVVR